MENDAKIYVAGHTGLVGSALMRGLKRHGYHNIITRTKEEADLTNQAAAAKLFAQTKPDYAFISAARVGGVYANSTYPAEFIYENIQIIANTIHEAYQAGVKKLVFLGSACIYPKLCPTPIKESYLMTGPLEPTVAPYSIAKIAGVTMCQAYNRQYGTKFISAIPTNIYGINDNYDPLTSHVVPALIQKFVAAKQTNQPHVIVWGTGTSRRELMHSDDVADCLIFLMNTYNDSSIINVGTGHDTSISELAHLIKELTGYHGDIIYDTSKPDGTPRRQMDVSKLHALGYQHKIGLREGITQVIQHHLNHQPAKKSVALQTNS